MYKIASYIQMVWPFQLKFEIHIFGVIILQMTERTKFSKIESCIFNNVLFFKNNYILKL